MNPRKHESSTSPVSPRRQRMTRDVSDFGIEWRILAEAARLATAAAAGATLTFWLVGPGDTNARPIAPRAAAQSSIDHPVNPHGDTTGAAMPELLAPLDDEEKDASPELPLPQRDAASDGGGH